MIVSVNNITFSYPGHKVLDNVGFTAEKGELVAILGPNGTGKTTLLKCINRILKPASGTVFIGKIDSRTLTGRELARKIGYVEQQRVGSRCTVFNAVLLGRKPHIRWDVSSRDLEIVSRALEALNIAPFAMRYLDELSGGELQKVIIARALAQEPAVLLMDEPTNHLDLKNQLEVLKTIRDITHEKEICSIVTVHDLNLALRYGDRFILMKDKKIYAAGGPEILTPENIENVYSVTVDLINYNGRHIVVPV